jgi:hypothetical protein
MSREGLFEDLPETKPPEHGSAGGKPRMREPVRDQIELRAMDIDSLIGLDHPARVIWGYAEQLDLRELEDAIKAREGAPGGPAIAPRLLLAVLAQKSIDGNLAVTMACRLADLMPRNVRNDDVALPPPGRR